MIRGITFSEQITYSRDFAHFQNVLLGASGVTRGCGITELDGEITVSEGYFFVSGREVAIEGSEVIAVPDRYGEDLYCKIVFEIDLTKTNTIDTFAQGYFKTLVDTVDYPAETQENLDAGGSVYQMPFATYILTSTGITEFADIRPLLSTQAAWEQMNSTTTRLMKMTERLVNGQQLTDTETGEIYTIGIRNGALYITDSEQNTLSYQIAEDTSSTFQKNEDGTLTTTFDDGRTEVFQKNVDGSLQTTFYNNGKVTRVQKITKNADGTIRTEYTEGGDE